MAFGKQLFNSLFVVVQGVRHYLLNALLMLNVRWIKLHFWFLDLGSCLSESKIEDKQGLKKVNSLLLWFLVFGKELADKHSSL